jgi:Tol biopolymer transport system component
MNSHSTKFADFSTESKTRQRLANAPYILNFGTLSPGQAQQQTLRIESVEKTNATECQASYSEPNAWFTVVAMKSIYRTTLFPMYIDVAVDTNHLPSGRRYDGWISLNAADVTARVMLSVNVAEPFGQRFLTQISRQLFLKLRMMSGVLAMLLLVYTFILASSWWPVTHLSALWSWLPQNQAFAGSKPEANRSLMKDGNQLNFAVYEEGQLTLYAAKANGANQHSLHIAGWSPVWSPNGDYLAFISKRSGTPQLYLIDSNNDEPLQLTNSPDEKSALAWSPDQKKIAFISGTPKLGILKIINIPEQAIQAWAKKQPTLVTEEADALNVLIQTPVAHPAQNAPLLGAVNHFSWSPDGKSLLFALKTADKSTLFKAVDQTGQLFTEDSWDPAWSADGNLVAAVSQRGLYTLDKQGQNVHQINTFRAWSPSWSPDGHLIAFLSDQENAAGAPDLWITDIKGRYQARLTTSGCLKFAWSPDGQQLAFITGTKNTAETNFYLWLITPGQAAELIAEVGEPHISWRK